MWLLCALCALLLGSCSGGSTAGLAEERDTLASANGKGSGAERVNEGEIVFFFNTVLQLSGDLQFQVNSATQFLSQDGTALDQDTFDFGDSVRVVSKKSGRTLIASSVTMLINRAQFAEFNGRIDFFIDNQVSVQCILFTITEQTEYFLFDGTPTDRSAFDDGDLVEVWAFIDGEDITLVSLTLVDDNDSEPQLEFFSGIIYQMHLTQIELNDFSLYDIGAGTEWILIDGSAGTQSDFSTDDTIRIIARLDGTSWTTIQVRMIANG
jgi:hypothetical protein